MVAEYVACKHCGRPILPRTWERNDGACALCATWDENENSNSAPTESLPEKRDPLDVDPAYEEIMESISELAIDAAIRETNERFPYLNVTRDDLNMGLCHRIWHHKKRLLKELHGLEWSSPAELNPHIWYD